MILEILKQLEESKHDLDHLKHFPEYDTKTQNHFIAKLEQSILYLEKKLIQETNEIEINF